MPPARSESFDSINTATSTGTEHPLIHRSNSMDSFILKKQSHSKSTAPKRMENGRRYNALVESASVKTTFSMCDGSEGLSHSFPDIAPSPSSQNPAPGPQVGGAKVRSQSGNDVTGLEWVAPANQEPMAASRDGFHDSTKHSRRLEEDKGNTHLHIDVSDSTAAHLNPDIIHKLTQEEWRQLISYTCTTLGRSLLTSILHQQPSLLQQLANTHSSTHHSHPPPTVAHPQEEDDRDHASRRRRLRDRQAKAYKLDINSVLRKLQETDLDHSRRPKKKLERTSSLPPLHKYDVDQRLGAEPGNDSHHGNACSQELSKEVATTIGRNTREHGVAGGTGHGEASGNCSDNQRSLTEDERLTGRHRDRHTTDGRHAGSKSRRHSNGAGVGGGHRRKLRNRSRSDGVRDPNSLVDASLDDDCPGVPENRIRRSRHQHQHQHYVCRLCLEELGSRGWSKSKMTKKGWCRRHSPDQELVNSSGSGGDLGGGGAPVGPALVVSLDQVQALERSTELTAEDSGNDDRVKQVTASSMPRVGGVDQFGSSHVAPSAGGKGGHREGKHHHSRKKNGSWNDHHIGKDHHNHRTPNSAPNGTNSKLEDEPEWQGVAELSTAPSRSGRDSPATDMAVCCLDMDSPRMLEPQEDHMNHTLTGWEDGYHLYLHNHQHFHHIIHHSQP